MRPKTTVSNCLHHHYQTYRKNVSADLNRRPHLLDERHFGAYDDVWSKSPDETLRILQKQWNLESRSTHFSCNSTLKSQICSKFIKVLTLWCSWHGTIAPYHDTHSTFKINLIEPPRQCLELTDCTVFIDFTTVWRIPSASVDGRQNCIDAGRCYQ